MKLTGYSPFKYENPVSEDMTSNYSNIQFEDLSLNWEMRMYITRPGSDVPMDTSEEGLVSKSPTRDEIFDNILKKYSGAWRHLSEM